jgi:hypothetical protein
MTRRVEIPGITVLGLGKFPAGRTRAKTLEMLELLDATPGRLKSQAVRAVAMKHVRVSQAMNVIAHGFYGGTVPFAELSSQVLVAQRLVQQQEAVVAQLRHQQTQLAALQREINALSDKLHRAVSSATGGIQREDVPGLSDRIAAIAQDVFGERVSRIEARFMDGELRVKVLVASLMDAATSALVPEFYDRLAEALAPDVAEYVHVTVRNQRRNARV